MKNLTISAALILTYAISGFGQSTTQKGIDPQTQQIKQDSGKTTQSPTTTNSGDGRSLDWGKGKTKVRSRLANPYKMNSRRDVLIETIRDVMESMKILIDDTASRTSDGIIVSQPYVFAKGAVTTRSELSRYAVLPYSDSSWTRGRYTLTVEVQSIDGVKNNVSVTAKVEGRSENGLMSEWTTLQSAGTAEEEFLIKLVESVTGILVDPTQDND